MKNAMIPTLAVAQLCLFVNGSHAEEFDAQEKAIEIILEAADRLCKNIPLYSSSNGTELSVEGKAELNEIVKKVIGAGITGAAKYEKKESQFFGVLQKDLATLLKDNTNCRIQVWNDLQAKLIAPYSPDVYTLPVPSGDVPSPTNYVKLGPDLPAEITSEDCRNPRFATGSAWQVGRLETIRRNYESAYFCNLFSAGVGSLDLALGRSYRELRVTIGIADNSGGFQHRVKFEIIGDGRVYLDDVTLRFGETRDLKVNVRNISRLKLKITELDSPDDSDSPSKPFWANLIAVPSHMARATGP